MLFFLVTRAARSHIGCRMSKAEQRLFWKMLPSSTAVCIRRGSEDGERLCSCFEDSVAFADDLDVPVRGTEIKADS